ncbi:MAG TPA: paraquat-inducible protein A [Pseudomonadales bacterium]|jgi:paraquat-inducible protein A|nr:paraquat-inducible protein A [Pseudomonadales bacterium]HNI36689.1 paraquat-inducible protein A [Pseudomonadales bacterium]HNL92029.1 paraquat-inducible protein A [Pseudomonadales bacterium]HNN85959.1 paraquat-inducible protein A [Pseudomonadales bacterium]
MDITTLPPKSHLTACAECDLLLANMDVPEGRESLCPRCGHGLQEGRPDSVLHAVILSVIGLILLVPAMGMPLLSLSSTGLRHDVSITHAVLALGNSGYWEVASLVAVCALAAPFLNLWLIFAVGIVLQMGSAPVWLPRLLRINYHVREWAMPEVFLMAVLVSVVKLKDMAQLLPGVGLYCFICLMLCTLLIETLIDQHELWQAYEKNRAQET